MKGVKTMEDGLDSLVLKPRRSTLKTHWSIQAARGEVTSQCLCNACKAIAFGVFLLFIGATLAVIGYYDEYISSQDVDTVQPTSSSNESASLLYYFTFVGPIVMGIGGFIVVAACVMTLEARDSASKIVPARFKRPFSNLIAPNGHLEEENNMLTTVNRMAVTSSFTKFSQTLQASMDSGTLMEPEVPNRLHKCSSAPDLAGTDACKIRDVFQTTTEKGEISPRSKISKKKRLIRREVFINRHALSMDASNIPLEETRKMRKKQEDSSGALEIDFHRSPPRAIEVGKAQVHRSPQRMKSGEQREESSRSREDDPLVVAPRPPTVTQVTTYTPKFGTERSETARRHLFMRQTNVESFESDRSAPSLKDFR
ncbi:unnamed protein product [Darwinula stevensoni]|uniref:Uncharacterized protein n=1 Tax=Darwinula stevensoni TaxID=69355 RepID=A0A7R9A6G4_9CRUS|nr:unnamed protein product [Darwinula stevensoni]CAG0889097.1 unnamed protein product [Darwinula stevensoni]